MVFRNKYNARVDTMSKTSASHKHIKTDPRPTDRNAPKISSHSALSVLKKHQEQPSHQGDTVQFPTEGLRDHISPSQLLMVQPQKPKPVNTSKKYCKVSSGVRSDSKVASATVCRTCIHRTCNRRSQPPSEELRDPLESAGLDTSPRSQYRNSSASTRSGGSRAPRTKSQHSRPRRKQPKKQHPSREQTYPAYVCEKHKRLAKLDLSPTAAPRLSAGDGGPGPTAKDAGPAPQAGTGAAPRRQTAIRSSHSIPLVLGRKSKPPDDPERIPAEAAFGTSIHQREYLRLRKHTTTIREAAKNPNNCDLRLIKFHNVEIIEQLEPQLEPEGKVILKIIHKSRQLQQPQRRLDLVALEDTQLAKEMLDQMLENWATVVRMWQLEGYLRQEPPYETVEYDARQHRTPSPSPGRDRSGSDRGSVARAELLPRRGSIEAVIEPQKESQRARNMVSRYLRAAGPVYRDTITTQLRYNYRRQKRFYPVHLMEHVLKYKRPPFWNYGRKYRGFSVLLNKYQLEHLYELVPPKLT